jgi:hypothetical protein
VVILIVYGFGKSLNRIINVRLYLSNSTSKPIGIETRPQSNVSLIWLAYFVVVLVVEIATIPLIYRRPRLAGVVGILAAILNILFVVADQVHLLQPEVAPFNYSVLQGITVITSIVLVYFSWTVSQSSRMPVRG